MGSKRGQNRRPARYKPSTLRLDYDQDTRHDVVCPTCRGQFDSKSVAGEFAVPVCPLCGASVVGDAYDEAARVLLADRRVLCGKRNETAASLERLRLRIGRFSKLPRPLGWIAKLLFVRGRDAKANAEIEGLDAQIAAIGRDRCLLAESRYYASEWYRQSAKPLTSRCGVEKVDMEAFYNAKGEWRLAPRSRTWRLSWAQTAEMIVFEALAARTIDPMSPLFGARVIANLYIPSLAPKDIKDRVPWRQVDVAMLTRSCAVVIEVNAIAKRFLATPGFQKLLVPKKGDPSGECTCSVTYQHQCSLAACRFAEAAPQYPYERVFEAVALVDPHGFDAVDRDFVDNVFVCAVASKGVDGASALVGAVERAAEGLDNVMEADELDCLCRELKRRYGETDGRKLALHVQSIGSMGDDDAYFKAVNLKERSTRRSG